MCAVLLPGERSDGGWGAALVETPPSEPGRQSSPTDDAMMTRRSSELLIIRSPAACMVAGTALIVGPLGSKVLSVALGWVRFDAHECGVATLQIKTQHVRPPGRAHTATGNILKARRKRAGRLEERVGRLPPTALKR